MIGVASRSALLALLLSVCLPAQKPEALSLGRALTDFVELASSRSYSVDVADGRFVSVEVQQLAVDIALTLYDPDGAVVAFADATSIGSEYLSFVSRQAGTYRLVAASSPGTRGRYTITMTRVEPVARTPQGRVDQIMSRFSLTSPGAVVVVVRDGKVLFEKGYGLANLEYGIPNTPGTPFHVASISKQFTAFAIAKLAEEGRLSLDDDVRKHLPSVPDFGRPITLRHLLHHTSGIRDQWDLWAMAGGTLEDVIRQEDVLRLVDRQRELNFSPGAQFLYSNTGYSLLAAVVERVTGATFREWMAATVFSPLGMTSTSVRDQYDEIVPQRAYSYVAARSGYANALMNFGSYGATDVVTTGTDLARWLHNFRVAAEGAGGAVGSRTILERMQQRGVLSSGDTIAYGFGLFVDRQGGIRRLHHGGVDAGFMTIMSYYPEIDAGVIVLSNTATFYPTQVGFEIAGAFFADAIAPEVPRSGATWSRGGERTAEAQRPSLNLTGLAGRYFSDELETTYTLVIDQGEIIARHRRLGNIKLRQVGESHLQSEEWFFRDVMIDRDATGVVRGFRVSSPRARNVQFRRLDTLD